MDRLTSILLAAGLGCFLLAFALSGLYPWLITDARKPEATIAEVAYDVTEEFRALKEAYPVAFDRSFARGEECLTRQELLDLADDDPKRAQSDEAWRAAHADALQQGRDEYISQACWHCHSQYVRPVAKEVVRFGRIRTPADDNNALQRPVMWGTRRVGPDLTNEGGKRSNDWHIAHLWDPKSTSPDSVMPRFTWYFADGFRVARKIDPELAERQGIDAETTYPLPGVYETQAEADAALKRAQENVHPLLKREAERYVVEEALGPNTKGLAIVAYLQWLGTWDESDRREVTE